MTFLTQGPEPLTSRPQNKISIVSKLNLNQFSSNIFTTFCEPLSHKKTIQIPKVKRQQQPLSIQIESDHKVQFSDSKKPQFMEDQVVSFSAGLKKKPSKPKYINVGKLSTKQRASVDPSDIADQPASTLQATKAINKLVKLGSFSDQDEPVPKVQQSASLVLAGLAAEKVRSKLPNRGS